MRVSPFRRADEASHDRSDAGEVDSRRGDSPRADSRRTDSERAASPEPGLAARLAEGARGGFVATLVMTAYRLPVSRSLPPTARFWAKFVSGGDADDHPIPAVALHLLYGVAGGVVYGLLAPVATGERSADSSGPPTDPSGNPADAAENSADAGANPTDRNRHDATEDHRETARLEAMGLLTGALYALALSVFGERVVLGRLLDLDLASDERLVFHAGHLVYGLSLGTWFGSRTGDRRRADD